MNENRLLYNWLRKKLPFVAILRGVQPNEVTEIATVLFDTGFRIIEVPMNSPQPLASIERLASQLENRALVGAGTVTTAGQVAEVARAGGRLIVSPHYDVSVVAAAQQHDLLTLPGIFTASEAFAAIAQGVDAVKLFPAEAAPAAVVKALITVLPESCSLLPVGGITPDKLAAYLDAGTAGFGLGGALYRPGIDTGRLQDNAAAFAAAFTAWHEATGARL